METARSVAELRATIAAWRRSGEQVGFVPTMGNLHDGHLSLVELARRHAERSVVSIFVNPLQFGPGEDFERYPRTVAEDIAKLEAAGVDLLFLPEVDVMYPPGGAATTFVEVPGLSDELCGRFRPGHFRGVATVVLKLLNLVQPDHALFGEKDFQQLTIIRRMCADLNLPVRILAGPTEREPDGLAMSSRNGYLTPEQRQTAAELPRVLRAAATMLMTGSGDVAATAELAAGRLRESGFRVDYVEFRRVSDLATPSVADRELIVLAAAWLGSTRLIDNLRVSLTASDRE